MFPLYSSSCNENDLNSRQVHRKLICAEDPLSCLHFTAKVFKVGNFITEFNIFCAAYCSVCKLVGTYCVNCFPIALFID